MFAAGKTRYIERNVHVEKKGKKLTENWRIWGTLNHVPYFNSKIYGTCKFLQIVTTIEQKFQRIPDILDRT